MAVTDVNNYTNLSNITVGTTSSTTAVTDASNDTLGKDAFLKLLIAQLSNQDPLDPMDDTEFVSQMATFSTLEQMQNMNSTLTGIAGNIRFSAQSYIGKAVAFTNEEGTQVAAVVTAVWFDNNKVVLDTTEGEVDLDKIEGVSNVS